MSEEKKKKASPLTIASASAMATLDMIANYYYFSNLASLIDGSEDSHSPIAVTVGICSVLLATPSIYTRVRLYTHHQQKNNEEKRKDKENIH